MGDGSGADAALSYEDWQSRLSAEFFSPDYHRPPIIMFIDGEELARICPETPDPVGSLRAAVLAELRRTNKLSVLEPINRRVSVWSAGPRETPPPSLPLLAITVLAGSKMRNDGVFRASAYYPRLVELMTDEQNSLTAEGLQKHFDVIAEMWRCLDTWIEGRQDVLGPSTISNQTYAKIGYPLSQTVLKTSDRERLFDFFDQVHLDQRPDASPPELLRLLRLWLDRPRGFSTPFTTLVREGSDDPFLLAVIAKLAVQTRTELTAPNGHIRLHLGMCVDLERWAITWAIRTHPGLDTDHLKLTNGSMLVIARPDYGSTYRVISGTLPEDPKLITERIRATGTKSVLTKDLNRLWILRTDPLSGMWLSVGSIDPGAEHLLLVQDHDTSTMDDLLAKAAEPGYVKLRGRLIPGWIAYAGVILSGQFDLPASLDTLSLVRLLRTDFGPSPRLVNGLPLPTDVGGQHYLSGGEPDLLIPPGDSERFVHVVLDGSPTGSQVKANGSPLPLRLFGPFPEGKHSVKVDGLTLEFFVHTDGSIPRLACAVDNDGVPADGPHFGQGPAPLRFAVCRRGRNAAVWFFTSSGQARQCTEPGIPSSMQEIGFPKSYMWKVAVPGDASGFVIERDGKFSAPRHVDTSRPSFGSLDDISKDFWRRIASETIDSPDRWWRSYLSQFMEESLHER